MKTTTLIFSIIFCLFFASCATTPEATPLPEENIKADMVELINIEREKIGLQEYENTSALQEAAAIRAEELMLNFSTLRPDGSSWTTVLKEKSIESTVAIQYIMSGSENASDMFDFFIQDANGKMLSVMPNIDTIGIANVQDAWVVLLLQELAPTTLKEVQSNMVALVNSERARYGLSQLKIDSELQKSAQVRAKELESYYSHTRPDGTNFYSVINEDSISLAENIATGQISVEQVTSAWMNSPEHRENILNPNHSHIGIGIYNGNWVQLFMQK